IFLTQPALIVSRKFSSVVLILLVAALASSLYAPRTHAQTDDDELGKIITPDIARRSIKEAMLDSENFELGVYFGLLTVEDFGSNEVTGFTLAYHVTEDFFLEAAYG